MPATLVMRRKTHRKLKELIIGGPTTVKVGFPSGKTDSDTINKAVWNEFGTKGGASGGGWGGPIPERPFMRNSVRKNKGKYKAGLAAEAAPLLRGETSIRTVLSKLGEAAKGDIQAEITSLRSPPNSPVTIKLKGSSNPLIDSGEMRAAVTWKIED